MRKLQSRNMVQLAEVGWRSDASSGAIPGIPEEPIPCLDKKIY